MTDIFTVSPIGVINSPFETKEACPIQPKFAGAAIGTVMLFPDYAAGLKDIEGFSHIYLVYLFDRAGEISFVRSTFLDDTPHGIYASRHPCRPNSVGFSVVRLLKREESVLTVEGIDVLDKTPLIDIKPYLPKFDLFPDATNGWAQDKSIRPKPPGRE